MQYDLDPSDDVAAAALAAIQCYVEQESLDGECVAPSRPAWRAAALAEAHGLETARGTRGTWGAIERDSRARRWSYGIVGL